MRSEDDSKTQDELITGGESCSGHIVDKTVTEQSSKASGREQGGGARRREAELEADEKKQDDADQYEKSELSCVPSNHIHTLLVVDRSIGSQSTQRFISHFLHIHIK